MEDKGLLHLFLLACFIVILFSISLWILYGTSCNIEAYFDEDKYCRKYYTSNLSNSPPSYEIASYEQDRLYTLERERILKLKQQEQVAFKQCYDEGYFVNESFSVTDYGLNCNKIGYLNDHLMDNFEKKDAGYISGHYSGFFSSGSMKGQSYQYVNNRVLATGMLIENINYHVDCKDVKHNENIDYMTEEEFVMYYVEECIA